MSQHRILIASDHAGFELKERLVRSLKEIGGQSIEWVDLGPTDSSRVDYPDFADRVASRVAKEGSRGVLICGSGQGMAIRANKYRGVRAALVWNEEIARLSRGHNDANILCLGSRFLTPEEASKLVSIFMTAPFEGGRHQDRVSKLSKTAPEC